MAKVFENFCAPEPTGGTDGTTEADFRTRLQDLLPKLVLAPSFAVTLLFVYGFILFTVVLSFTGSKMLPRYDWVGFENYEKLFALPAWTTAITNIAIFATLYITICTAIGLMLAIFLDQKIRGEGVLRPIYLYPMALSFIVTGTAWKWFLDPGIGLERIMHQWAGSRFSFTWIKDGDMAIYTIVIAAVWQTSGFVMAMFLAGLRGIDNEILKAAQIDGASNWQLYRQIVIPLLRPAFLSAFVILSHLAIKSYDLVIALTAAAPAGPPKCPRPSCIPTPSRETRWASAPLGRDHAHDHRSNHGPLPLCRAEGEEGMSVATQDTAVSTGHITRAFIYLVLILFALFYLLPLYVMGVNSLKPLEEITGGNMMALPQTWTLDPWRSAWSTAQIGVEPTGLKPISSTRSLWSSPPSPSVP